MSEKEITLEEVEAKRRAGLSETQRHREARERQDRTHWENIKRVAEENKSKSDL